MSQKVIGLIFIAWCRSATSEWFPDSYGTEPIQMPPAYLAKVGYRDQYALHSKNSPAPAAEYDNFIFKTYPTFKENFDTDNASPKNDEIKEGRSELVSKRSILNSEKKIDAEKNHTDDTIALTRNKRWIFDPTTNSIYARPHTNSQNTFGREFEDSPMSTHDQFPYYKRGFSAWGGKRAVQSERGFTPKQRRQQPFYPWGGKRNDPSMMKWFKPDLAPVASKTLDDFDIENIILQDVFYDKRTNQKFHSWGGKRNNINLPIFDAYSVQPVSNRRSVENQLMDSAPILFWDNWKKDGKNKLKFSAWGGKRSKLSDSEVIQLSDMDEKPSSETNDDGNNNI